MKQLSRFFKFLVVIITLIASLLFLISTQPGFFITTALLRPIFGIQITKPHGTLDNQWNMDSFHLAFEDISIDAKDVHAKWSLKSLFLGKLPIKDLSIRSLKIAHKRSSPPHMRLYLPFHLELNHVKIDKFQLYVRPIPVTLLKVEAYGHWYQDNLNLHFAKFHYRKSLGEASLIKKQSRLHTEAYIKGYDDLAISADFDQNSYNVVGTSQHLAMNTQYPIQLLNTQFQMNDKTPLKLSTDLQFQDTNYKINIDGSKNVSNIQYKFAVDGEQWVKKLTFSLNDINNNLYGSGHLALELNHNPIELSLDYTQKQRPQLIAKFLRPANIQGTIQIAKAVDRISATGKIHFMDNETLSIDASVDALNKIAGSLKMDIHHLNFISKLYPHIQNIEGHITALMQLNGSLDTPILQGAAKLTKAKAELPYSGLTLAPIDLLLKFEKSAWVLNGKIVSNQIPLTLKGMGKFLTGTFSLRAHKTPIIHTDEYNLLANAKLDANLTKNSLNITGQLNIPTGIIKPNHFSNTIELSEDVNILSKKNIATPNFDITADISLIVQPTVKLYVKGLDTALEGKLRLIKLPHEPMIVDGILQMINGKYQAFGQTLKIRSGSLTYDNSHFNNPIIQMRAAKKPNTARQLSESGELFDFSASNISDTQYNTSTKVGIEVYGRLTHPKISLFSIPANLPQADILSLLLLGKPANNTNQSGAQLLIAAISSMDLDEGNKGMELIQQLKGLGFNFSVAQNTLNPRPNTEDNTSFVVGKALSDRLYLSYNMGINNPDNNMLTLQYLLNRFFSIQLTQSQNGNGVDVLYKFSSKKTGNVHESKPITTQTNAHH